MASGGLSERQYCELCGKLEQLLRCGRCRSSLYCSKEHQRQDWKKHKLVCQGATPAVGDTPQPQRRPPEPLAAEDYTQRSGRFLAPEGGGVGRRGGAPHNGQSPGASRLAREYLLPCMEKHGICVLDDFLGAEAGEEIAWEVRALWASGRFTDGQLVNQKGDSSRDIRGDRITWVEGSEPGCGAIAGLMGSMDDLIRHCNGKMGSFRINGRTKEFTDLLGRGNFDLWAIREWRPGLTPAGIIHAHSNPCLLEAFALNRHSIQGNGGMLPWKWNGIRSSCR